LALVTIMQFAGELSDWQVAEAVRARIERIDWRYALGLELTDSGFDFSVRYAFRARRSPWMADGSCERR
jgi:transposase